MRGYPAEVAQPTVLLKHKEEALAQQTRDDIRMMLPHLLPHESKLVHAIFTNTEQEIQSKREKDLNHSYPWARLPNEVKNMIYELLLIHEGEPIQPFISYMGDKNKEHKRKNDLGAHTFRTGKTVLREALPILLGRNTFEINRYFHNYIGYRQTFPPVWGQTHQEDCSACKATSRQVAQFVMLTNLDECTIISDCSKSEDCPYMPGTNHATEAQMHFRNSSPEVLRLVQDNPRTGLYYLQELQAFDGTNRTHAIRQIVATQRRPTNLEAIMESSATQHQGDALCRLCK